MINSGAVAPSRLDNRRHQGLRDYVCVEMMHGRYQRFQSFKLLQMPADRVGICSAARFICGARLASLWLQAIAFSYSQ